MKVFKSLLSLVLALTLGATVTVAQQTDAKTEKYVPKIDVEKRAQNQTDRLAKEVEMTEKQVEKVKSIYLKYGKKEIEARKIEDKREFATKVSQIRKDQEKAILDVMTDEQRAAYKDKKAKKAEEYAARKKRMEAENRAKEQGKEIAKPKSLKGKPMTAEQNAQRKTDRMVGDLSLTREQIPEVQKIQLDYFTQLDEAMNSIEDRSELSAKVKGLKEAKTASLKKVLTDEQFKKMTEKK